jgi:predicted small lipoprotein YifL
MWLSLLLTACLQEGGLYLPADDLAANPPVNLSGRQVTERFPEPASVTSDVLWVVDNSCSMLEEQQRIADNADPFIQHFLDSRQLDWHIGFVTTDMFTDAVTGGVQGAVLQSRQLSAVSRQHAIFRGERRAFA